MRVKEKAGEQVFLQIIVIQKVGIKAQQNLQIEEIAHNRELKVAHIPTLKVNRKEKMNQKVAEATTMLH